MKGKHLSIIVFLTLLLIHFQTIRTKAQTIQEVQKLLADDGASADVFGISVHISGNYAIVGASGDDNYTGAAYIFTNFSGLWTFDTKLTASDAAEGDEFGLSVCISEDYAIVGAHTDDDNGNNSGSAYIFHNNSGVWSEYDKLTASDGEDLDSFGASVSISGDYAIIGAFGDDNLTGAAYIFYNNSGIWTEIDKIVASDAEEGDWFGASVSISGDYCVVGAFDHYNDSSRGAAYIFQNNAGGFEQVAKLLASDGDYSDSFGRSVSISNDYVIIGSSRQDNAKGAAYIFEKPVTGWEDMNETFRLSASDGEDDDTFGLSVYIKGDTAIIGAPAQYNNNNGSAYIFIREPNGWEEISKLTASDASEDDRTGNSVCINDNFAIIGALFDDDNGANSGSAYLFNTELLSVDNCTTELFKIFPNPASKFIKINSKIENIKKIKILDFTGKELYTVQGLKDDKIDISQFGNGIYILVVETNETVYSTKIIKI